MAADFKIAVVALLGIKAFEQPQADAGKLLHGGGVGVLHPGGGGLPPFGLGRIAQLFDGAVRGLA
jgi:hypothetical protein